MAGCKLLEVITVKSRLTICLTLLVLTSASVLVSAQGTPSPLGIVPTPTPQPLTVNVWTDRSSYAVGETLRAYYSVSQPAYIYLYDIQSDGIVRLVFPNAYSQSNFVSAGTHVLPDRPSYQYTVTYPTGMEKLQIFASPTPLALTPSSYSDPFPMTSPNEIQGHIMGITPTPTPTWTTAWTSFTVTAAPSYSYTPPSGYTPMPPYSPFYPPFYGWPGACWYWKDGEWHYGTPSSGWYWYFGPDGKWHFSIRIRFGGN